MKEETAGIKVIVYFLSPYDVQDSFGVISPPSYSQKSFSDIKQGKALLILYRLLLELIHSYSHPTTHVVTSCMHKYIEPLC